VENTFFYSTAGGFPNPQSVAHRSKTADTALCLAVCRAWKIRALFLLGLCKICRNGQTNKNKGLAIKSDRLLGRFFDVSPQFWMNLQSRYDLESAADDIGDELEQDIRTLSDVA
jgi:hypothetical protein